MKHRILAFILAAGTFTGSAALASEDYCNVPMSEWQPREALRQKLEGEGWKVRSIKTDDGCYEVYAIDAEGRRVEALYNPRNLELVKSERER